MRRLLWWLVRLWSPRFLGHEWAERHGQVVCSVCGAYEAATAVGSECPVRVLRARGF